MKLFSSILLIVLVITIGTRSSGTIYQSQILDCAEYVSGYMETYRLIPETIPLADDSVNFASALELFANSILLLDIGQYVQYEEIPEINPPINLYPDIILNEELYQNSFSRSEYIDFCEGILDILNLNNSIPDVFEFNNGDIRIPETFYLLSGILRFYDFYGILPETQELLIISSKGLVPWETPSGFEHYTAINNDWIYYDFHRYNLYSVGQYDIYQRAQLFSGNISNYYDAAEVIYDSMWSGIDYSIYIKTFGGRMSTSERSRHKLQNSARPALNIAGQLRSLGIPCTGSVLYDDNTGNWINIDTHCLFGSNPDSCYHTSYSGDSIPPPIKTDKLVQKIKSVMTHSGNYQEGFKSIWLNPADILEYGAINVIDEIESSGFNAIILTVKTELGNLYYPTNNFQERHKFDALTELINACEGTGIEVYPAISVFADQFTLNQHFEDWKQYKIDNPSNFYPNMSISPCICEYKSILIEMLNEISQLDGIAGIVLAHLFWDTTSYAEGMGGNPNCEEFNTGEGWQEDLLEVYGTELRDSIKSYDPNLEVLITTHPVTFSCYPNFDGHEDKVRMAEIADRLIVPYDGNFWLSDFEDWHLFCNSAWEPQWPVPFDLESYISQLASETETPIVLSQNLTEEWVFPAMFYSGLFSYALDFGAEGLNIHSPVSMLGENGPAYRKIQLRKAGSIDFNSPYITGDFDRKILNQQPNILVNTYPNPLREFVNFEIDIKEKLHLEIRIFNMYGNEIEILADKKLNQGKHTFKWFPPSNQNHNIFIYRIILEDSVKSGKIILSEN